MATASLWFLDTLVTVQVSWAENADHISVLEHRAPAGDSPPLHVHHTGGRRGACGDRAAVWDRDRGAAPRIAGLRGAMPTYMADCDLPGMWKPSAGRRKSRSCGLWTRWRGAPFESAQAAR